LPRVPRKKIKIIIQSVCHVIRKKVTQRKCTVNWPRGYSKTKKKLQGPNPIFFFFKGGKTKSALYYRG